MQSKRINNENIDVIVLDISRRDKQFGDYEKLSSEEKVDKICNLIKCAMEKFKEDHDDGMKIFACREYFVSDPGSRYCENNVRKSVKNKMLSLTKQYPTLCIISGTIATKKHFDRQNFNKYADNIMQTEEAYRHAKSKASLINEFWVKNRNESDKLRRKASNHGETSSHFFNWKKVRHKNSFDMVRNTCYLFQGNTIMRRDKVVPFNETDHINQNVLAFRPGRGETANPIKFLTHPNTGKQIAIAIEICVEHSAGYLKVLMLEDEQELLKNADYSIIKPEIHFVLSDTTSVRKKNICSDCFIHVDSVQKPICIQKPSLSHLPINFCIINVLDSNFMVTNVLKTPIEEFNLVLCIEFLDACISILINEKGNDSLLLQRNLDEIKNQLTSIFHEDNEFINEVWKKGKIGKAIAEWNERLNVMESPIVTLTRYKDVFEELIKKIILLKDSENRNDFFIK